MKYEEKLKAKLTKDRQEALKHINALSGQINELQRHLIMWQGVVAYLDGELKELDESIPS